MTATAHTSHAGLTLSPAACSGAMYSTVANQQAGAAAERRGPVRERAHVERLGETEIKDLRYERGRVSMEKDVLRLQVAMNDAELVSCAECGAHPAKNVERLVGEHR